MTKKKLYSCLILAGGYGSRLFPVTLFIPKILLKFNGVSLLEHHLHSLKKFEIKKIFINILDKFFYKFFLNKIIKKKKLYTILEKKPIGNGGAIRKILLKNKEENLIIIYSDIFFLDKQSEIIEKLIKISNNKFITISISKINDYRSLKSKGNIIFKNNNLVNFIEKPKTDQIFSKYFFSGIIYVPKKQISKLLRELNWHQSTNNKIDFAEKILMSNKFNIKVCLCKKKPLDFGNWIDLIRNYY